MVTPGVHLQLRVAVRPACADRRYTIFSDHLPNYSDIGTSGSGTTSEEEKDFGWVRHHAQALQRQRTFVASSTDLRSDNSSFSEWDRRTRLVVVGSAEALTVPALGESSNIVRFHAESEVTSSVRNRDNYVFPKREGEDIDIVALSMDRDYLFQVPDNFQT
ncbi:unnamed protein product [Polarella glacialis]|uniref:Uncharacterized protein n=1 Tax=Polarella glacialis TaxID=89957 RepID=A0A813EBS7_POLGL|nr:unnamed protein product [Polarella glacialis]CAE8596083.1 unnamed protein product [Polarella glacialis]